MELGPTTAIMLAGGHAYCETDGVNAFRRASSIQCRLSASPCIKDESEASRPRQFEITLVREAPCGPVGFFRFSQSWRYRAPSNAAQNAHLCAAAKFVSCAGVDGIRDWKFPAMGLKLCQAGTLGLFGVPNLAKFVQ
jgi:hypothetical protein